MWSGAPQWASWALHPKQFQNMSDDKVDWASLAKQWIQMKETVDSQQQAPPLPPEPPVFSLDAPTSTTTENPPAFISPHPPPPPPPGSPPITCKETPKELEEGELQTGGEMDMEIEDEKDPPNSGTSAANNAEAWQQWWNGSSSEGMAAGWGWGWGPVEDTNPVADMEHPGTSAVSESPAEYSRKQMANYAWGSDTDGSEQMCVRNTTDYGHRSKRLKVPYTESSVSLDKEDCQLDANQRRKLPIWIREGLEKMEREKQRKLDREREEFLKEEMLRRRKEAELQAKSFLEEGQIGPTIPSKSKFESDSEGESNTSDRVDESEDVVEAKESEFEPAESELAAGSNVKSKIQLTSSTQSDTKDKMFPPTTDIERENKFSLMTTEERTQEMMTKLRRWMTEILLDVTSSLMQDIASEVLKKARMRAPQVQVKKNSALAALSRGLGLSMYSDSDEEDDESKLSAELGVESEDSDDALRNTILRKKKEFELIEKSIFQKLRKLAELEKAGLDDTDRSSHSGSCSPSSGKGPGRASPAHHDLESSETENRGNDLSKKNRSGLTEDAGDVTLQSDGGNQTLPSTSDEEKSSHDRDKELSETSEYDKREKKSRHDPERRAKRPISRDRKTRRERKSRDRDRRRGNSPEVYSRSRDPKSLSRDRKSRSRSRSLSRRRMDKNKRSRSRDIRSRSRDRLRGRARNPRDRSRGRRSRSNSRRNRKRFSGSPSSRRRSRERRRSRSRERRRSRSIVRARSRSSLSSSSKSSSPEDPRRKRKKRKRKRFSSQGSSS